MFSFIKGMHKKSMEAAECLQQDDETVEIDQNEHREHREHHEHHEHHDILTSESRTEDRTHSREKQEFCSESIAVLRAKAQEHNAKITQNITDRDVRDPVLTNDLLCRRLDENVYRTSFEDSHLDVEIRVV